MENNSLSGQSLFTLENPMFTAIKTKKLPQLRQRVKENSRLLPTQAVDIMTEWYDRHYANPYPTYRDCEMLATKGNISINQVKQWFVNVRRRTQNQFRKTRDTRCTKRKNQTENTNIEKKVKIENAEINQSVNFYQSYSLDSSTSDYSTISQSNSPTTYRFNYSTSYSSNQNSLNLSNTNISPVISSSPINQNDFSQYSSTSNKASDFNAFSNYYSNNNSDYLSYYHSPQYYYYYNNYQNNYQYY